MTVKFKTMNTKQEAPVSAIPQSAGVWVKASERLPGKEGDYFVIYTTGEKMVLYASGTGHHSRWKALVFEWLDESQPVSVHQSGQEKDAVGFAEWIDKNVQNFNHVYYYKGKIVTLPDLYTLYLNRDKK